MDELVGGIYLFMGLLTNGFVVVRDSPFEGLKSSDNLLIGFIFLLCLTLILWPVYWGGLLALKLKDETDE